ncbi:RNA methyltransferase, partial [Mesorhizobium sp. B2-7-1]
MPATEDTTKTASAGPAIILVEPQLGENIGMVARAM